MEMALLPPMHWYVVWANPVSPFPDSHCLPRLEKWPAEDRNSLTHLWREREAREGPKKWPALTLCCVWPRAWEETMALVTSGCLLTGWGFDVGVWPGCHVALRLGPGTPATCVYCRHD